MTEPTLDLSNCPDPGACEVCGASDDPPAVLADTLMMHTVRTQFGVFCLTRCARCARAGATPELTTAQVADRVEAHRSHASREA